jgi:isopenicillin-N epimerase
MMPPPTKATSTWFSYAIAFTSEILDVVTNTTHPVMLYTLKAAIVMKNLFVLAEDTVFLNHGSFGACPRVLLEAQQGWQLEMEKNPVEFLSRRSAALLQEARTALAGVVGADPAHLVYIANATHAVNTIAHSVRLAAGDQVLTTDHEYGACDNTWQLACRRAGASYRRVEIPLPFQAEAFPERVWAQVTERTRVLFLSHITSATALIFPLQELCRRARAAGILTVIDGAHVPGHIPLDLNHLGPDFYTGNCHKWLCAPKGSAFLYARPEHHASLDGLVVSWGYTPELGGAGHDPYTGTTLLERRQQWQGTRDLSAFLTVPAAIRFQAEHDWDQVRDRCHRMAADTLRRVCARTGLEPVCAEPDFGQMVVIPVPACDPAALQTALFEKHHIEIPVTGHGDRVFARLSVQGYNTAEDLDALVAALGTEFGLA